MADMLMECANSAFEVLLALVWLEIVILVGLAALVLPVAYVCYLLFSE